ncbi:Putative lipoprotein LppP [Mycobacterium persicum]|uniref:Lipoprotein LppP n=1 Tax=Mycobacterium persicum TaxID=1487726 RepID=A0AB38UWX7_9MYCO|nr:LppP/LprE family lipoprotein [Mycobacterium persicum]VAZ77432.1 Putative lipoprotein LppP [Mycobacterium persicum]VAZ84711.1 Putative lipoprotein LppP [Mycobacterium persicum]VAZ96387.1 Putative lipoprotein LppP [Mycobacterium persicum]
MIRRCLAVLLGIGGIAGAAGCAEKSSTPPSSPADTCKQSDGPAADTVRQSIAAVPIEVPGSSWVEIARGHTRKCRLYWVQIIPTIASESTPQQLLFFDRNTPLGSPTPGPKPYITVLPPDDDTVTVQYRWRVGDESECCPSGIGTVRFQIGPDGKLKALGPIPHS